MAETRKIKKLTKTVDEVVDGVKKAVNYDVQVESAIRDSEGHKITSYYATKSEQAAELDKKQDNLTAGSAIDITSNTVGVKVDGTTVKVENNQLTVGKVDAANINVADADNNYVASTVEGILAEIAKDIEDAGQIDAIALNNVALPITDVVKQEGEVVKTVDIATAGTYNAETNKIATESAVKAAIDALDVTVKDGEAALSAGKTLATLTEVDGKIAATFQDIEITSDKVTDLDNTFTTKFNTLSGSATIVTATDGIATIKGGITETAGKIANSTDADVKVYTQAQSDTLLARKVDKEDGKGLSSNDFTTADKNKLAGISPEAKKVEATAKTGKISIDGTEVQIIPDNTVTDANYKHITVGEKSISDGTVTINNIVSDANYKHITVGEKSISDGTVTINNIVTDANYTHIDLDTSYVENTDSTNGLTHKAISGAIKEVRDIAAGKTKTFVVNYTTDNPTLNSQDAIVTVSSLTTTDKKIINPADIKIGDNVLIIETDVPDRWVSAINTEAKTISLAKLETTKVNLTNYMQKDTDATVGNIAVFDNAGNVIDAGYQLKFTDVTLIDVTD